MADDSLQFLRLAAARVGEVDLVVEALAAEVGDVSLTLSEVVHLRNG